ncbi:MAG TPA: DUF1353 domain-containing protein, partial [Xanthobacteraceae bacterium]|nr:DUF1353 domain-containing protein [Xanthobacteraceae bacterium]
IGQGDLSGRVLVEWVAQDRFVYRKSSEPLSFRPSFMGVPIVPETMFTDGGSIPQVFWGIPGLSPWGLGPAYIIHDWLFEVHRCGRPAPKEITQITFEQSALILAEVGRALIEAGLIRDDMLEAIVWAVRTRYARSLWDRPGTPEECAAPRTFALPRGRVVANFVIPPRRTRR